MDTIREKVKEVIAEQLGVEREEIKDDSSLADDYNLDSLDAVEIVMNLEDVFEIHIPDGVAEKLTTVAEIIQHIEKKKKSLQKAT